MLVVVGTAVLVGAIRFAGPPIYCGDGYFNIRYAEVLREHGPSRSFPVWQETFLREHFADKEFLYHVFLIPFTFGDLLLGARLAAIFFASLAMATFYVVLRRLKVPWALFFSFALIACSSDFLYRLTFTRSLVLALSVALAGTGAILLGRVGWAFVLAAVYANTHVSFHLLPCAALLHDLHRPGAADGGRWSRFRMTLATLSGTAAGCLVNPFVPYNLRLWWDLNFRVLWAAWSGRSDLRPVSEVGPQSSADLLLSNAGVFVALAAAVYLLSRARKVSAEARTLLVMSFGFLALTMMSQRFAEMWAPFTLLLAAVAARDARDGPPQEAARPPAPGRLAVASLGLGVLLAAGLLASNFKTDRDAAAAEEGSQLAGASTWMKANVPSGETVFHPWMDDYAEIFFFNPQLRCLVGWDSILMYVTDPARYRLWVDVAVGRVDDLFTPIRRTFRCRFVCAIAKDRRFLWMARRDPRFRLEYEDRTASVFRLDDDGTLVGDWRVTGWYPDPARRLLDVPVGAEPGAPAVARDGAPDAQGPAAVGIELSGAPGFVDLDRALAVPAFAPDACAVAEATVRSGTSSDATLAFTTDDEIKAYFNGQVVLEASPYRHPPPGRPGGPPLLLGDLKPTGSHLAERIARVRLQAGENAVIVKSCKVGDDFGFFLRAFLEDGEPVTAGAAAAKPRDR